MVRRKEIVNDPELINPRASKTQEKKKKEVPNISYFTLFRFATKSDKVMIAMALIFTCFTGIVVPYAITLVANVFQDMINYEMSVRAGKKNSEEFLTNVYKFCAIYFSLGIIFFVGGYTTTMLMSISAINQVFKLRQEYLKAALNQDFAYYDLHHTGDFASKIAEDVLKFEEGIGDKLASLIHNSVTALACIVMAWTKGWKLALLCLSTAPISFALVGVTGKIAQRISKKEALESGNASAVAEEVLSAIRTVYSFNGQKKEIMRYGTHLRKVRRMYILKELSSGLALGFLFFCIFASYAVSFYFGTYLIIHEPENYNADVMFSVFIGVMTGLATFGAVGPLIGTFGSARGAGAQIFHLIDNVPTINPVLDKGLRLDHFEGNIELKQVEFHYPTRDETPVLNGLSLSVKRGQSVALVGHSGCGKSSIIQLISRYYDVISGSVTIDGHDVRELSVRWLRSQIGLVGQEPVLFNTTVRENIRYGREGASDEDIEAVARQANAHQFIMKLPQRYDTRVGEGGASISGGQKQRIAIARALLRNPTILLLDEATSALDTSSEAKVQVALEKAAQGRTTVVVAHRLSTIRSVDVIYVLKNGKVAETGNHADLMKLRGLYYDMVILQDPEAGNETGTAPTRDESKISESENNFPDYNISMTEGESKEEVPPVSYWRVAKLNAPEWKAITLGSVCAIAVGFTMPIFIVFFGQLFGAMTEDNHVRLMQNVVQISVNCVLIAIALGGANFLESVAFGIAGGYLTERLRLHMFEHLLKQSVSYFDKSCNSTGALCARLSSEAALVQRATGQRVGVLLHAFGSIGLALCLAMWYEWRVALVALSFVPFVAIIIYYQSKATKLESFGTAQCIEKSTTVAVEAIACVRTVASLGLEARFLKDYVEQLRPAMGPAKRSAHFRGVVAGVSRSIFSFMNSAALTYGAHIIVSSGVNYENILVTTQVLQIASTEVQTAFTFTPDYQKGINAASRIIALLVTKPDIIDTENPIVKPYISKGEATFTDVEFKYPNRPAIKILRGLNLRIDRGKTVALVGQSGCGKSTVITLLQRYYDADSGTVELDGFPIQQLLINDVREGFGLVSQEPVLFDRTIAENIAYGDNERTPTQHEIEDAAKESNIHNFIVSLPQGYETNIGTKGLQLSGGQKQRVAIARALIRHPKILLLDEATSALDTESEKAVQEALDRAKAGRTCVTIAHRLSTIRDADVICVVVDGRVVESGTHDELVNLKGNYYKLQARVT